MDRQDYIRIGVHTYILKYTHKTTQPLKDDGNKQVNEAERFGLQELNKQVLVLRFKTENRKRMTDEVIIEIHSSNTSVKSVSL